MDVNAQIALILQGCDNVRKAKEPYHIDIIKFKKYQNILNLLNLLTERIDHIQADDINSRMSEHMIIVTWKGDESSEIEFNKEEAEILSQILELCDGMLMNNKLNDWAFFVCICKSLYPED